MAKEKISANLSKETYHKWKKFVSENCINASQLLEKLIQEHINNQKKNKNE